MSEKDGLYPVIRRVERGEAVDHSYQNLIEVKKGWLPGSRTLYLVSHNNTGQASARGELLWPVKAHERDWTLHLRIKYTAATTASGLAQPTAKKVVDAIGGDHPQASLEQRIGSLVGEFLSQHGGPAAFIEQFEKQKTGMAAHVKNRIEDTVGLSLNLAITPTTGGRPFEKTRKIDKDLNFKVQDYPNSLMAKLSLDLDAQLLNEGPQYTVWAYIYQGVLDQLAQDLLAGAEQFLKSLCLHQLQFEINDVRKNLRDLLQKLAGGKGRAIGRFSLECQAPAADGVQRMERISVEPITFANLLEYPETVEAKCELQLELARLGVYIEQKSPNLKDWATKTLRET